MGDLVVGMLVIVAFVGEDVTGANVDGTFVVGIDVVGG